MLMIKGDDGPIYLAAQTCKTYCTCKLDWLNINLNTKILIARHTLCFEDIQVECYSIKKLFLFCFCFMYVTAGQNKNINEDLLILVMPLESIRKVMFDNMQIC